MIYGTRMRLAASPYPLPLKCSPPGRQSVGEVKAAAYTPLSLGDGLHTTESRCLNLNPFPKELPLDPGGLQSLQLSAFKPLLQWLPLHASIKSTFRLPRSDHNTKEKTVFPGRVCKAISCSTVSVHFDRICRAPLKKLFFKESGLIVPL